MPETEQNDYADEIEKAVRKIEAVALGAELASDPEYLSIDATKEPGTVKTVLDTKNISFPMWVLMQRKIPIPTYCDQQVAALVAALAKQELPLDIEEQQHYASSRPKLTMKLPNTFETVQKLHVALGELVLKKAEAMYTEKQDAGRAKEFIGQHVPLHIRAAVLKQFSAFLDGQSGDKSASESYSVGS